MLSERDKMFKTEENAEKEKQLEIAEFHMEELISAISARRVKNLKYYEEPIVSQNERLISDVVVGSEHTLEWETHD